MQFIRSTSKTLIAVAILLCSFQIADGRATVYFRYISFTNRDHTMADGRTKCDRSSRTKLCDYVFKVSIGDKGKIGRSVSSPTLDDYKGEIIPTEVFNRIVPQPLAYLVGAGQVPAELSILITVLDDSHTNSQEIITTLSAKVLVSPTPFGTKNWQKAIKTDRSKRMEFEVAIECERNYYGASCANYCEAQSSDNLGHYTCSPNGERICNPTYSGPGCNIRNACANTDVCNSRGTCVQTGNSFVCQCNAGFEGLQCERATSSSPCDSHRCENGGTCIEQLANLAACSCSDGWAGQSCQLRTEIPCDGADANFCQNSATCVKSYNQSISAYGLPRCLCASGFSGLQCEIPDDPCILATCRNNATCVSEGTTARCVCATHFSGQFCEHFTNPCESLPCRNGGTCNLTADSFVCTCPNSHEGSLCEVPRNPCLRNTELCLNNSTCVGDYSGAHHCNCLMHFSGSRCEIYNDPCAGKPCQHGTCEPTSTGYVCICDAEFFGQNCSMARDPCRRDTSLCLNGGTCVGNIDAQSFYCRCNSHYFGEQCETYISPCANVNCLNGGSCTVASGNFQCECVSDFEGRLCEISRDPCLNSTVPVCANGGTCVGNARNKAFHCICPPHYTGHQCSEYLDPCASQPCGNRGTCNATPSGYVCSCTDEYFGDDCRILKNPCSRTSPCVNGGTCVSTTIGQVSCQCPPLYYGKICEKTKQPCNNHSCVSGQGRCIVDQTELSLYRCDCFAGFNGSLCESAIDYCLDSPCENGGLCQSSSAGFTCQCAAHYSGARCSIYTDPCINNNCANNATCIATDTGYSCICTAAFEGARCTTKRDACIKNRNFCLNGGNCVTDAAGKASCLCPVLYEGKRCQTVKNVCQNSCCIHGQCIPDQNSSTLYRCECLRGYEGPCCELKIDPCNGTTCMNNGTCVAVDSGATCECRFGFDGVYCENAVDFCSSQRCRNGGTCVNLLAEGSYRCQCLVAFGGPRCTECLCRNGGHCKQRRCECPQFYQGDLCETKVHACDRGEFAPCINNGKCNKVVDGGPDDFYCTCPPSHTGRLCNIEIDYCLAHNITCNLGNCSGSWVDNNFTCDCLEPYSGKFCQHFNACSASPCSNGGTCLSDLVNGTFNCLCKSPYSGNLCQNYRSPCERHKCRNGATCKTINGTDNYTCVCTPEYTGQYCQTRQSPCRLHPCVNGLCKSLNESTRICECYDNFTGVNCEILKLNACVARPCAADETCLDNEDGSYSCFVNNRDILTQNSASTAKPPNSYPASTPLIEYFAVKSASVKQFSTDRFTFYLIVGFSAAIAILLATVVSTCLYFMRKKSRIQPNIGEANRSNRPRSNAQALISLNNLNAEGEYAEVKSDYLQPLRRSANPTHQVSNSDSNASDNPFPFNSHLVHAVVESDNNFSSSYLNSDQTADGINSNCLTSGARPSLQRSFSMQRAQFRAIPNDYKFSTLEPPGRTANSLALYGNCQETYTNEAEVNIISSSINDARNPIDDHQFYSNDNDAIASFHLLPPPIHETEPDSDSFSSADI